METEHSSYRLPIGTHCQANDLASDVAAESGERRSVLLVPRYGKRARMARICSHCVGLGEALLGPLYAWSSAMQGKPGAMRLQVMLRVLASG